MSFGNNLHRSSDNRSCRPVYWQYWIWRDTGIHRPHPPWTDTDGVHDRVWANRIQISNCCDYGLVQQHICFVPYRSPWREHWYRAMLHKCPDTSLNCCNPIGLDLDWCTSWKHPCFDLENVDRSHQSCFELVPWYCPQYGVTYQQLSLAERTVCYRSWLCLAP